MKKVDAPMYVSLSTAFNMLNVMAIDSWQCKWDYEPTGHFTRQLIPSVGSKIVFPDSRDVGISYCTVDCYYMTLCYKMIATVLELLIHHSVPVGRTEKLRVIFC